MPIPETFPLFGWGSRRPLRTLRVMSSGDIWLLNWGGVRDLEPVWTVLGPDGVTRGRIRAGEELDVLDVDPTNDLVLVLRWDQYDVETVEIRRLIW